MFLHALVLSAVLAALYWLVTSSHIAFRHRSLPACSLSRLKPGDLVFFSDDWGATSAVLQLGSRFPFSHAGIVVGVSPASHEPSGQRGRHSVYFAHADDETGYVRVDEVSRYLGAGSRAGTGRAYCGACRRKPAHRPDAPLDLGPFLGRGFDPLTPWTFVRERYVWPTDRSSLLARPRFVFCGELVTRVAAHNFGLAETGWRTDAMHSARGCYEALVRHPATRYQDLCLVKVCDGVKS